MSSLPPDRTLPRANRMDLIGSHTSSDFEPLQELPEPPEYLNARAVTIWEEIGPQMIEAGLLHTTDLQALARYACIESLSRDNRGADMELVNIAHRLATALGISGAQSKLRVNPLNGRRDTQSKEAKEFADVISRLNA